MTALEIINAGTGRVRNDAALMAEYKRQFNEQFGYEPACPTCGDVADWAKFKNFAYGNPQPQILTTMANTTFQLKDKSDIYSYDYADKQTGRTLRVRTYGNIMTEDFAEKFLTEGTEEQIEDRKKLFKVLPKKFQPESADDSATDKTDLSKLKIAELQDLAKEKGYPEDEYKSLKKEDLVTYIEAKELEK